MVGTERMQFQVNALSGYLIIAYNSDIGLDAGPEKEDSAVQWVIPEIP
jgi:hypothetical protein